MASIETYYVRCLSHYVDLTEALQDLWSTRSGEWTPLWFRGQRRRRPPLPSLYVNDLAEYEEDIRDSFQRRAIQLAPELSRVVDPWEWYFLMQHYGAPTRLLDWSDGSLIALFFAVQPVRPYALAPRQQAVVWVVDPVWLNSVAAALSSIASYDWPHAAPYLPGLFADEDERAPLPKMPLALDPPHVARRLSAQRAHFTVFGSDKTAFVRLAKRAHSKICQLVIPPQTILGLQRALETSGVTESTVYPDLNALSNELTYYYASEWRRGGRRGEAKTEAYLRREGRLRV